MSGNGTQQRSQQSRTDTLIGEGLRVEGDIAFSGVLRILGEVRGEISCDADGTAVIGTSGFVGGAIRAAHIVVAGRVAAPLHSSASIEIHPGGQVQGDIRYRTLDIRPGGVIDGSLLPDGQEAGAAAGQQRRMQHTAATGAYELPAAKQAAPDRIAPGFGARRGLAAVLVLTGVLAIAGFLNRGTESNPPPASEGDVKAVPAAQEGGAGQTASTSTEVPRTTGGNTVPPGTETNAPKSTQATPSPSRDAASDPVAVKGVNPAKPGGVFSVVAREAAVLMRKKRQDTGEGQSIEVAQGASISVTIARNEVFRVAKGRDMEIFYQGRKVGQKTIESGAWMSFVPQMPGDAAEEK